MGEVTVFLLALLVLFGVSEADRWRNGPMMRMPMSEEEARKVCLFLPLESNDGRRLGTCCVLPGRHRRFFGEAVLARASKKIKEDNRHPSEDDLPPPRPSNGKPSCDIHPLMLREQRVGVCCTFRGRFRGKPEETILPSAGEEENVTEGTISNSTTEEGHSSTTIVVPISFDTRDFINSSCREGYVLNANYECVKEF